MSATARPTRDTAQPDRSLHWGADMERLANRHVGSRDETMFGHYIAMLMAEHGLVSAPNMAIGEPFHIGAPVQATVGLGGISRGPSGA